MKTKLKWFGIGYLSATIIYISIFYFVLKSINTDLQNHNKKMHLIEKKQY